MPEGIPKNDEGLDFDPNKDYVTEVAEKGVDSPESQEIQAETLKLQEQLAESDALFAELDTVPEEALQKEGVKEKISALYEKLETYREKFPRIAENLKVGGLLVGLATMTSGIFMGAYDNAAMAELTGHTAEAGLQGIALATIVTGEVIAVAGVVAAGVTRLIGKIGEWKTERAIYSN